MELLFITFVFGYIAIKKDVNRLSKIVLLFYAIGALFGFLLTLHPLFPFMDNCGYQDISWGASVYLIVGFLILFYPILKSGNDLTIEGGVNIKGFNTLAKVFIAMSLLYCIYILPYIGNAFSSSDFVSYKNEVLDSGGLDISGGNPLLNKIFSFQIILRPFITFLFFYSINNDNCSKSTKIWLGIMSILPGALHSLAAAHRNIVVFVLIDFWVCYQMFQQTYTEKLKRVFFYVTMAIVVFVGFITLYYAVLRFSSGGSGVDDYVEYSLYRYMGEPMVDFHTMIWGTDVFLDGNKSFPYVRSLLGMDYISPSEVRDQLTSLPYIIFFFYTIIGNFYMDFGPIGTMALLLIIAYLFNYLMNRMFSYNSITRLLIVFMFTTQVLENYFYFSYMGSNNMLFLWHVFFVFIIYRFVDNKTIEQC